MSTTNHIAILFGYHLPGGTAGADYNARAWLMHKTGPNPLHRQSSQPALGLDLGRRYGSISSAGGRRAVV